MSHQASLLERLSAIAGDHGLLIDPADMEGVRSDGRGSGGGLPVAVARPRDADTVAALVRFAAVERLRLVVQGARTGLTGAGLPTQGEVCLVVSLERLATHLEIDPVNRTVSVDAGARLSAVNAAAAEHGLVFPIDLGADPSIGGMIAANTGGARLLRYGDVRANVLSLDVICSDDAGTPVRLGAPLRKNNTGLDLKQLLIGGSGATGVVTRATLALQPLPAVQICALIALADPHAALPLLLALEHDFGTWLSAFEGISGPALSAAAAAVPALRMPFTAMPGYAILVEISAGAAFDEELAEDRLAATLARFMEGPGAPVLDVAVDRRNELWKIRHAVPEGLRHAGTVVACDIALRRGDVMRFRDHMTTLLAKEVPGFEPHDFGHIGDGGIHYNLVWPNEHGSPDPATAERARTLIFRTAVENFGGSFSAEHGVGPRNIEHYTRFVPAEVRRLAGSVQRAFAPTPTGSVDFGMKE